MSTNDFAWCSVILSVFLALRATRLSPDLPMLYMAFVLLGLSWAILLPYYRPESTHIEMLPALSSYIHMVLGFVLSSAAAIRYKSDHSPNIGMYGLLPTLLFVLAHPSVDHILGMDIIDHERAETAMSCVFALMGFFALVVGTGRLNRNDSHWLVLFVALPYAGLEIAFAIKSWSNPKSFQMPDEMKFGFSVFKLLLTVVLIFVWGWKTNIGQKSPWKIFKTVAPSGL